MGWHEDFGDEPSIEERMPAGQSPAEMQALFIEASLETCECCGEQFPEEIVIKTDMYEYLSMDLDPETLICPECYEAQRLQHIPSNPMLFDCWTPIEIEAAAIR